MAYKEIPVKNQFQLSSANGMIGTRAWVLNHDENLDVFLTNVCKSYWPGNANTVPVSVEVGPFDENATVIKTRGTPSYQLDPCNGQPLTGIDSRLLQYSETLVTCHYQWLPIHNGWPTFVPKPLHYKGAVMSLKIRGSGQFLMASPNAFKITHSGLTPNTEYGWVGFTENARVLVPITEYHVTCDRLTKAQVNAINPDTWNIGEDGSSGSGGDCSVIPGNTSAVPWWARGGSVNVDTFLGIPPGGLLFDSGWTMDETFAPDPHDPLRYRMTAVLRARLFLDKCGAIRYTNPYNTEVVGWNQDYWTDGVNGGFVTFEIRDSLRMSGPQIQHTAPRYPYMYYEHIFYWPGLQGCEGSSEGSV